MRPGPLLPLLVAFLVALPGRSPPAHAQAPSGGTAGQAPGPAAGKPADDAVDALVEELLTSEEADDDLAWLYSDSTESAEPSDLVGRPVPAPGLPAPGEGTRRAWDPGWRRFGLGHAVLTGTAIAVGAAGGAIPASPGRFTGRNDLDEWGRTHLGYDDYERGRWARELSDVTIASTLTYPLLIDSLIVMYWYRESPDVAAQMALISVEAVSVAAAIQTPVAGFSSRERPYGRDCGVTIDGQRTDCTSNKRYRSFFSGHTALSFAGASVSCAHHLRHAVFGGAAADGVSCGAGFAFAATTGMMRIVGRQHYITDVGVGAVAGTLSGFGIPWLLHYGPFARVGGPDAVVTRLQLVPVPNGIGVQGVLR
jgi:membrane-associated phospholipid phosphatase